MTEPMNPAEIAAMVAALRQPYTDISPEESADMLEALAAENATLRADYEDAFVRGMAHGQKVMPKGTFNIVDSPELATLRASEAAAVERAEALQAQLAAMTEARDAAVARVGVLVGMFDPYISPFSWESAADFHERVLGYNAKILAEGTPT